jgi:hypothetical protein
MSARSTLGSLAVAVALGAASEAVLVGWALLDPVRIEAWDEVLVLRPGGDAWLGCRRSTALAEWINVESVGPVVSEPQAAADAAPRWLPLPIAGPRHVRVAAIGVGWPMRAVGMRWEADRSDLGFPPPAEKDTSGDAPKEALRRLRDAVTGTGDDQAGAGQAWLHWPGACTNAAVLSVPWLAIAVARRPRHGVTRRG